MAKLEVPAPPRPVARKAIGGEHPAIGPGARGGL